MEALECGVVGVNDRLVFNEVAPFGGIKESGLGREGGEVHIWVTREAPDEAAMVDNGGPFFQSWCVHESIR
ncbi:hypothetical protein OKW40_001767 [Paraburkholderia sp. RAU6.4a]